MMIKKIFFLILIASLFFRCGISQKINFTSNSNRQNSIEYKGWWIYGEGTHLFQDSASLKEWNLVFLNEEKKEIITLYLSVTETEYFPLECAIIGVVDKDSIYVSSFEITHIEGCKD